MKNAIDMTEIKAKLADLSANMEHVPDALCDFGAELGRRLNPRMVPEGFNLAAEMLLYDIRKGRSGLSAPLPARLTGPPPFMAGLFAMEIPGIARATCPPEFADRVVAIREQLSAAVSGAA